VILLGKEYGGKEDEDPIFFSPIFFSENRLSSCCRYRHPRRRGLPHQGDFLGRQTVGFVDNVADFAFKAQGFGGEGAGGVDGSGVFLPEVRQRGRR
jgi:hypothetical protein